MRTNNLPVPRREGTGRVLRFASLLLGLAFLWVGPLLATSVIPITDAELYQRADVIVHGVVLSSEVTVDGQGRPETLIVIEPMAVLKGRLAGSLVLHQLGGTLPDGRFLKLWGRPEYSPGREVVVFAIARPEGEYQTAEMLLGKFEVRQDAAGKLFAVPDLAAGVHPGVEVHARLQTVRSAGEESDPNEAAVGNSSDASAEMTSQDENSPRALEDFLASLRAGVFEASASSAPSGSLEPVHHAEKAGRATPLWGNISDSKFRWNNNATATWTISGTANMDGGGIAEAMAALASWTDNSNSTINYVPGTGSSNMLYVNAVTSTLGCGWSTCLTGGGVIGCGGPTGVGGSNTLRGETYTNINKGVAELRASCIHNGFGSVITQSVLTHELGHTLGLGHSDQNVSTHDMCRGDEDAATMRAVVQTRTALGTDDQDAIRWLYGDGSNSCSGSLLTIGDFNSDGHADLLWRNVVTGSNVGWFMNNSTHLSGATLEQVRDANWQIMGTADFNGDGKPDLMWRNVVTGSNVIWFMDSGVHVSGTTLEPVVDTNWQIAATGDFNGDGQADLVWRNPVTGSNVIWFMNGAAHVSGTTLEPVSDPNWRIVGTGDFNSDGRTDLLWHNILTGSTVIWFMNGAAHVSGTTLEQVADTNWQIAAVADYNGDGKPDLIWRNVTTGSNVAWFLVDGAAVSAAMLQPVTDTTWKIVGPR